MAGCRGSRRGFDPRRRGTRGVGVGLSVPASVAIAGAAAPRDQSPPGWRGGSAGSGRHRGLRREIGGGRVEPVGGVTDLAEGVVDRAQDLGAERTAEVLGRASERRGVVRPERERPGVERPPRPDGGGIVEARPRRQQPAPEGATDGGRPGARGAAGGEKPSSEDAVQPAPGWAGGVDAVKDVDDKGDIDEDLPLLRVLSRPSLDLVLIREAKAIQPVVVGRWETRIYRTSR